ncbi:galactoside 2-alpha-L-fucosyltransferase 2-like [Pomacea canaliculata]|nr:galactoside 2-alpha-L-fucosyltransferase 2-like [Pomacea canaliculata]
MGRLGNVLFQYSSLLGLAHANNMSFYLNDKLGILQEILLNPPVYENEVLFRSHCRSTVIIRNEKDCAFDSRLMYLNQLLDVSVNGYLQSWKYFRSVEQEVRLALRFKDWILLKAERFVQGVRRKLPGRTLVGVHVRRTDHNEPEVGRMAASAEYLHNSMTYFRRRFSPLTFVLASDDLDWCRNSLRTQNNSSDVIFLNMHEPAVDMQILGLMDHMIITVGTFGWWAGFFSTAG